MSMVPGQAYKKAGVLYTLMDEGSYAKHNKYF
jgi:hypothetical protein